MFYMCVYVHISYLRGLFGLGSAGGCETGWMDDDECLSGGGDGLDGWMMMNVSDSLSCSEGLMGFIVIIVFSYL